MKKLSLIILALILHYSSFAQYLDWAKSFVGGESWTSCMKQDINGNIIICGHFYDTVDFDPGAGVFNLIFNGLNDGYLLKLDPNGNFIWAKSIGGIGHEYISSMVIDGQNNIYVSLHFDSTHDADPGPAAFNLTTNGLYDIQISKFNDAGNFIWAKHFGSTDNNYVSKLAIDNSDNLTFTITFQGPIDTDPNLGTNVFSPFGDQDVALIKLSNLGQLIWAKQIKGTPGSGSEGNSILTDNNNNIIYGGTYANIVDFDLGAGVYNLQTAAGNQSIFLSKVDSMGNFIWAKSFECNYQSGLSTIKADLSGNIIIGGVFEITLDADPGPSATIFTSNYYDLFLIKLSPQGDFLWGKQIGGPGLEELFDCEIDNAGNIYFTGYYEDDSVDMDAGLNSAFINPVGYSDIIIAKYDSNGNYVWAKQCAGNNVNAVGAGSEIELDNNENIIVSGVFQGNVDFDPNATIYNMNANDINSCVFKLIQNPVAIRDEIFSKANFKLYPNPAATELNIEYKLNSSEKGSFALYNIFGEQVMEVQLSAERNLINLNVSQLPAALYVYHYFVDGREMQSGKFLKQ